MPIERKTAIELAELYRRRESLQSHKQRATSKNLWIGVLTRGSAGPGETSGNVRSYTDAEQIIDAMGGIGEASAATMNAVVTALETEMSKLDAKIVQLGGEVQPPPNEGERTDR